MSFRNSEQIAGAPSRIGPLYAEFFHTPGVREPFVRRGRVQSTPTTQNALRLRGQSQPLPDDHIRLEQDREGHASNSSQIRILSIAGHSIVREGIGAILRTQADISPISAAATGQDGIEAYRAARPDVTLLDLQLPDISGIEVLIGIRSEFPNARIIMLATFPRDVEIRRALKAGAYGYLLKSVPPQQILEAIRWVHSGRKSIPREIAAGLAEHLSDDNLSKREIEVLSHVADGDRNRDIGEKLFIAEETVKVHLKRIMDKLDARDRTHAVAIAARRGFLCL